MLLLQAPLRLLLNLDDDRDGVLAAEVDVVALLAPAVVLAHLPLNGGPPPLGGNRPLTAGEAPEGLQG